MKEIINRVFRRIKRFWLILLLIPLLTAGLAYFIETNTTPAKKGSAYAEAQIELGSFNNIRLTAVRRVFVLVKSTSFLEDINKKYNLEMPIEDIQANMVLTPVEESVFTIGLKGIDKEIVESTLTKVIDGFLDLSQAYYNKWVSLNQGTIEELNGVNVHDEELVAKQKFLYDLNLANMETAENQVLEPVSIVEEPAGTKNPKGKAVFGFLIGIMFSLFLLLIPEVFRSGRNI